MTAQSLNHGKPVTTGEAREMRERLLAGQSRNHIANAMGRSWTSVNRYARGLTWIETRNPKRPAEEHLRSARVSQWCGRRARKQHEEVDQCMYFIGPWL